MAGQRYFPDGKKKAFTMSYDDGVLQDKRLLQIMNAYGIKGTFNLNSGFLNRKKHAVIDGFDTDISTVSAEEMRMIYQGHEIAAHGKFHKNLVELSPVEIATEVTSDRKKLEELVGSSVNGFAYPYGTYDDNVKVTLEECGIAYARTVCNTRRFDIPTEFLEWNPTCHHNDEALFDIAKKFCSQSFVSEGLKLFYLWGHSYEFDQRNNWNRIEQLLEYISRYQEDIWFATNGEIYDLVTGMKIVE